MRHKEDTMNGNLFTVFLYIYELTYIWDSSISKRKGHTSVFRLKNAALGVFCCQTKIALRISV